MSQNIIQNQKTLPQDNQQPKQKPKLSQSWIIGIIFIVLAAVIIVASIVAFIYSRMPRSEESSVSSRYD